MLPLTALKHVGIAIGMTVAMVATTAFGSTADASFYEAYYLEQQNDVTAAAELYTQALDAGNLNPKLELQARAGLASCREEIACADFAKLMPPDTLVYFELNNPGDQLAHLLDMLGLMADDDAPTAELGDRRVAISPVLIDELMGIRGVAAALTGFDPISQAPTGVAVFHPGNIESIRGIIETMLPAATKAVKPIEGYPTYNVEDQAYVCLTSRLVIVSAQRPQIVALIKRMNRKIETSLATNEAMADVLKTRNESMLFFCANAKPFIPIINGLAGASRDLAMANAIVDLNSLRWISGRAGVGEHGPFFDLSVRLDQGQRNLAYNLLRTPPITRDTLSCIPSGCAGFMAAALGETGQQHAAKAGRAGDAAPPIVGLDFGRELFANIIDFAIYAVPPANAAGGIAGPAPDIAAVIRVNDPAKSEALWTQILGIATLAAGAPTTDGTTESIAGADVRSYRFPDNVTIRFATVGDKVLVAATPYAMQRAVETVGGADSVLQDAAFAPSLARVNPHTSKALFVHPGRCFEVARRFMNSGELAEAEPVMEMLSDLVASIVTDEAEELFRLSATATGMPDVGQFVSQMIEQEHAREQLRRDLKHAKRAGQWDEALATVDEMLAKQPDNLGYLGTRFDILANGKKDRSAAMACAEQFVAQAGNDCQALNRMAWDLLTNDPADDYLPVALDIARKATELTNYRDSAILDTLALAEFKAGNVARAIELQRKAVTLPGGGHRDFKERLAKYEAAAEKGKVVVGSS